MIDWQNKVVAPCNVVFGQAATITFQGQVSSLNGTFDEAYGDVDASDGMPVTTLRPCLGINTAEIVNLGTQPLSALQGSRLTVFASTVPGGAPAVDTDYIVREARADGHGWARLILNLAPVATDEISAQRRFFS